MPTSEQWETVKQQCASFSERGYIVKCDMQSKEKGAAPLVRIAKGLKVWQFSDPDWDIVIKQLAQLWKIMNVKEMQKH